MSNVTLRIGGRDYTVACAEGEEAHIAGLGRTIDSKIQEVGAGSQTESRQLLFAALLLADELQERAEQAAPAPAPGPGQAGDNADLLERIAERLEACAQALEG